MKNIELGIIIKKITNLATYARLFLLGASACAKLTDDESFKGKLNNIVDFLEDAVSEVPQRIEAIKKALLMRTIISPSTIENKKLELLLKKQNLIIEDNIKLLNLIYKTFIDVMDLPVALIEWLEVEEINETNIFASRFVSHIESFFNISNFVSMISDKGLKYLMHNVKFSNMRIKIDLFPESLYLLEGPMEFRVKIFINLSKLILRSDSFNEKYSDHELYKPVLTKVIEILNSGLIFYKDFEETDQVSEEKLIELFNSIASTQLAILSKRKSESVEIFKVLGKHIFMVDKIEEICNI